MTTGKMDRRTLIRTTAGAAGALALAPLIQACQTTTAPVPDTGKATSGLKLPTYKPHGQEWGLPKPDLPPDAQGIVSPAYFKYPKGSLVKTVKTPPGKGAVVTGWGMGTPAAAKDNPALAQLNKELGVDLQLSGATGENEQRARVAVMMAGADPKEYPDFLWIRNETYIRGLNEFLEQEYTDLGPFLAGDKVLDYPNLAALPTYLWRNSVRNDKLMGVMSAITMRWGEMAQQNEDMWTAVGGPPKTADDFLRMAKELNRPREGVYAIGDALAGQLQSKTVRSFYVNLWGGPNGWKLEKGKLIKDIETDEVKAAVEFCRQIQAAGLIHPDASTLTSAQRRDLIFTKKVAFLAGFTLGSFMTLSWAVNKNRVKLRSMEPFGWDGKAQPNYHFGPGGFGIVAIKKGSDDRVRELLGVADYMLPPFGSVEWQNIYYGVEGYNFTYDKDGNPTETAKGLGGLRPMISPPDPIYSPFDTKTMATFIHAYQTKMAAIGVADPTVGLTSAADTRVGPILNQLIVDTAVGIVNSRLPLSAYDQLVKDWRSRGGDQIRGEFEEAIAKQAG